MEGNNKVIDALNQALACELIAINQYLLHGRMQKNWGLTRLGEHSYRESIDEMRHADRLIERILLLEGIPNLQDLGKLMIGENVREMLTCDLNLENRGRETLAKGIAICEESGDYVSRKLLVDLLDETEEHIDWIETQLGLIERMGMENYAQLQSEPASS